MIFNIGGGGEDSLKLPVLNEEQPADLNVEFDKGGTASANFSIMIEEAGYPAAYSYRWYLDGEVVAGANAGVFSMKNLSTEGTHSVYCEVTNAAGTVTSRVATLTIREQYVPVLKESMPADVSAVMGSSTATFSVQIATDGKPATYTYQWYLNDAIISGATNATYTKSDLTTAGTFTVHCVVTNAAGSVTSRRALLSVGSCYPTFTFDGSNSGLLKENTYDWKIKLYESGILNFSYLGSAVDGQDIFCVGGGGGGGGSSSYGGGGGGGKTSTTTKAMPTVNTNYQVYVGAGGPKRGAGGTSSITALSASAAGGSGGADDKGGAGGSGGGAAHAKGGSDGDKGGGTNGGAGQNRTTREFGETGGALYSGGGGGATYCHYTSHAPMSGGSGGGGKGGYHVNYDWGSQDYVNGSGGGANTGGGGGGGYATNGLTGGSGIVIIRNAR